ncbi:MAG TPA: hypothetical protein DCZ92_02410 [Elusimicrobia bacterium]|nr:MAG: hypothetical protein A2016_00350 [Elusimicrobia bacterium GWF2_62_30]HBA59677.1 hypothetical protein [Elusimicrobiota bacterium]
MKQRKLSNFCCAALLLACAGPALAATPARVNPAFLNYAAPVSSAPLRVLGTGAPGAPAAAAPRHVFGFRPSPVDMSYMAGKDISAAISGKPGAPSSVSRVAGFRGPLAPSSYDNAYDLRDYNKLTAIRDQGACGDCWAFATYASMESKLLPGETRDFSEAHLDGNSSFDWASCDGGVSIMSAAYLARWSGPVNEGTSSPVQKHVQGMYWLPIPATPNETAFKNNVKAAITTDGAVYSSIYWDDNATPTSSDAHFYNSRCSEPYGTQGACTCSGTGCGGHAIALVGWNDTYAKENFTTPTMGTPAGNGAFLARNSWGLDTGISNSGYFYISYYDTSLGGDTAVFNDNQAVTNYTTLYQYDPLGYTYRIGNGDVQGEAGDSTTEWMANIFDASAGQLNAVGFYTTDVDVDYELRVYTGVTAGSPTSGTLAHTATGNFAASGYHTVPVGSVVMLVGGTKFSVVVKLINSADVYPIAAELNIPGFSSGAGASAGQSYISPNGSAWTDLTTITNSYYGDNFNKTNVCLKAYADADTTPPTAVATVYDGAVAAADIDETGSTSQLSANWTSSADPETGVYGYYYAIGTGVGSADVAGWTANGGSQFVTRTGLTLASGTTYYFGVKAVNGVGAYSSETWSDGQLVDTSLPAEVAYVSDGLSADIDFVSSLNRLSANWGEVGGTVEYRYAIGSTPGTADVVAWTTAGTARFVTRTTPALTEGSTYYFAVMAYNGLGVPSVTAVSDGQRVDVTSPTARVTVTSGLPAVSSVTLTAALHITEATGLYISSPALTFDTFGSAQTAELSLASVVGTTWTFTGHVETWYSTGTATFSFSARDMAGNLGTSIIAGGTGSTFVINTAISGAAGGYVANSDTMAVTIPPGAYSGSLFVRIATVTATRTNVADAVAFTSLKPLTVDLIREFRAYDANGVPITSFALPVTLTMSYPDADEDGRIDGDFLAEAYARMYYLDEAQGKWTPVVDSFVRDTAANTISAKVSHFSVYAVRVQAVEQTSLSLKAYPNPCDFRKQPLALTGIPLDATNVRVHIYNSAAELVRTLTSGDGVNALNEVTWDGRLRGGAKAATGLYIYLVKTAAHGKGTGKFFGSW